MAKWGVILMNLGTPEAPTKAAYRSFLKEFLSDKRVVEVPRPVWWAILNLFILPFRPSRLVSSYEAIWDPETGSPLVSITRRQVEALAKLLTERHGEDQAPVVTYAMTYGSPKLADRISELRDAGIEQIFVLPLYPQYSATTTAPVYDQYARVIRESRDVPDVTINKSYYDRSDYNEALVQSVKSFHHQHGASERLLMSFHGIPQRNVTRGDPYYDHCQGTADALVKQLGLEEGTWGISFQSRLGYADWLQPYTVDVLKRWGSEGVKTVDVVCPAFAADCLETLEEIAIEGKEEFQAAGGENLRLIPCLNDNDLHIQLLANIVAERIGLTVSQ